MDQATIVVIFVILLAYLFDFINGFHDAANSIATTVTTGVLKPREAVLWAAFFNLTAFVFFHLMVAKTIGTGLIDMSIIDTPLIFAALIGAIFWNLLTWYFGLPSSSSHALIGGLAGAGIAKGGFGTLKLVGFIKVGIGIVVTPCIGLLISLLVSVALKQLFRHRNPLSYTRLFKGLQLTSSAFLSITHGGNDAQKTMGIITLLLLSSGFMEGPFSIPFWVVISCQLVISLGTLAGGWRIVHTMGTKITKLNTVTGCTAEASAAAIIFAATEVGIPVSTTQTVTGAIAGVGLVQGPGGTQWPVIRRILLSWLLTIPAAGIVAFAILFAMRL